MAVASISGGAYVSLDPNKNGEMSSSVHSVGSASTATAGSSNPLPPFNLSYSELVSMAERQKTQIQRNSASIAHRESRLRSSRQEENNAQHRVISDRLRSMRDRVTTEDQELEKLRQIQTQMETERIAGDGHDSELEALKQTFAGKERELSVAVAKIEELTKELEELRQRNSNVKFTNPGYGELERLRKDVQTQDAQTSSRQQDLDRKHSDLEAKRALTSLSERRIDELIDYLARRKHPKSTMPEPSSLTPEPIAATTDAFWRLATSRPLTPSERPKAAIEPFQISNSNQVPTRKLDGSPIKQPSLDDAGGISKPTTPSTDLLDGKSFIGGTNRALPFPTHQTLTAATAHAAISPSVVNSRGYATALQTVQDVLNAAVGTDFNGNGFSDGTSSLGLQADRSPFSKFIHPNNKVDNLGPKPFLKQKLVPSISSAQEFDKASICSDDSTATLTFSQPSPAQNAASVSGLSGGDSSTPDPFHSPHNSIGATGAPSVSSVYMQRGTTNASPSPSISSAGGDCAICPPHRPTNQPAPPYRPSATFQHDSGYIVPARSPASSTPDRRPHGSVALQQYRRNMDQLYAAACSGTGSQQGDRSSLSSTSSDASAASPFPNKASMGGLAKPPSYSSISSNQLEESTTESDSGSPGRVRVSINRRIQMPDESLLEDAPPPDLIPQEDRLRLTAKSISSSVHKSSTEIESSPLTESPSIDSFYSGVEADKVHIRSDNLRAVKRRSWAEHASSTEAEHIRWLLHREQQKGRPNVTLSWIFEKNHAQSVTQDVKPTSAANLAQSSELEIHSSSSIDRSDLQAVVTEPEMMELNTESPSTSSDESYPGIEGSTSQNESVLVTRFDANDTVTDIPPLPIVPTPIKGILKKPNSAKSGRRIQFDPLAILLDAALEGELDLVKKSAQRLPMVSRCNDEGITALHNAICAGHYEIVRFLVEADADVNAQDSDGWTPLHCAASCNNLPMVKFLVEHGACVFATTMSDHETPADKCEEEEDGFEGCSQFLLTIQDKMGVMNGGRVYAAHDYDAMETDELFFREGDELVILRRDDNGQRGWWWAKHSQSGIEGYIPRNYVALYPRLATQRVMTHDVSKSAISVDQDENNNGPATKGISSFTAKSPTEPSVDTAIAERKVKPNFDVPSCQHDQIFAK